MNNQTNNQTIRLNIPYELFDAHPVHSIKQLLSPNATIISYSTNSIITNDRTIPVDVVYRSISTSPLAIYYVPVKSLKKLIPDSSKYVAVIENCNVEINNPKLNNEYIPIRVIPILTEDVNSSFENYYSTINGEFDRLGTEQSNEQSNIESYKTDNVSFVNYMGLQVLNPLSSFCSAIISCSSFSVPEPVKLYTTEPKVVLYNFTIDQTINGYKKKLSSFNIFSSVTNVKLVKSTNEIVDSSAAYVVDYHKLTPPLKGVIMIQNERQVDYVLYYPFPALNINVELFNSIVRLIEYDKVNLFNINHIQSKN